VSRIERQRDEPFAALPIGGAVSSGVITSLEEGRVEIEEVSTELRVADFVMFITMD
jgi:hypothetical protein